MALQRVAVAGGGLAGLSAALALKDAGAHVELFERSRILGGRATSFELDGIEVDNGQHVFLACCTEFVGFARRVGMESQLHLQERFDATVLTREGGTAQLRTGALPAPLHLVPSFLAYAPLSARDKLQIARALVAALLARPAQSESFEGWLRRNRQGAGARRAFWDPFFIPALNAPFDRVAAADAIFVLSTAFLGDAGAARFGFSQVPLAHLAAAAAARLDAVHRSTAVLGAQPQADGVELLLPGGRAAFDAVVLALPPRQVARVLADPLRYGVRNLDAYDPYPIVDVHCWHDGGTIGLEFAAALESPLQWIFEKSPGYLCCSFSAAGEYLRRPTDELQALAWREVQTYLPRLKSARLIRGAVTRNPEATWLPRVGSARTAQRTAHPRLAIAGSWTRTGWPDTMESAVRSGRLAAELLAGNAAAPLAAAPSASEPVARAQPPPPAPAPLRRATEWLLAAQSPQGWWSGELETNVSMTAEHVLLFRFLGLPIEGFREGAIGHILRHQRADGSWALYYDGPADLSTTIEAYVALKVLGLDAGRTEMRAALRVIQRGGGAVGARVFTKIWLALFGLYPWNGVPSLPPELICFPLWMPFNIYDFACWARGTVAPLTIVISKRPVRPLGVEADEIVVAGTQREMRRVAGARHWLTLVERLQKLYERLPVQPFRAAAQRRVARWIAQRQEADGSWGGIQPPWVYSLIALDLMGYGLDHPLMRKGVEGMRRFVIDEPGDWRFQACMSPVWDTAWALRALALAGLDAAHPAMERAVEWLLREQIPDDAPGDWRMRCGEQRGNGWAFEFDNDAYPDVDDTAVVVLGLIESAAPARVGASIERATRWTLAMVSRNGAWAAFDRDNDRELLYRMPFSDFGAMIDPPTEDVTAHVLEMLAGLGEDATHPAAVRALDYLRRAQRPWGSWYGRWGVNHIYGTWCVVSALTALRAGGDMVERAAAWLLRVQNADGGWGESCHSYADESFAGIGASTPSQTAWAVIALQLAGFAQHSSVKAGLEYLCRRQLENGTWEERECTGTGFPRDFYINYHLYRHLFPTMALAIDARLCHSEAAKAEGPPLPTVKEPVTHT